MKGHAAALVDNFVAKTRGQDAPSDLTGDDGPNWPAGEFLTMQEVAKHLQLPCRTLRFFEDRGLVSSRHAEENRLFAREQLDRLTFSTRMRRIGFTIADIRSMLDRNQDQAHPRIDPKMAQAQREVIEQQIASLREAARLLDSETGHGPRE